jgi:ABC-type xylose transport system permease subunit
MENKNLTLVQRVAAPVSGFFKKIRTIGLVLVAIGGAIIAAPVSLPAIIVTAAGYLTVAGGVMTAVSQTTVEGE